MKVDNGNMGTHQREWTVGSVYHRRASMGKSDEVRQRQLMFNEYGKPSPEKNTAGVPVNPGRTMRSPV